jgi:general secretion pathway protein I
VSRGSERGFTLVEVLVALMIVAMGLAALMVAVSGAAKTSGYLRDKTLAQWIALNHLTEVRLNVNKAAQTTDAAELQFANRTWHYDTRYFDTSITTMKRVVVRVYAGDAKTKGNPLVEATSFLGTALGLPGSSNNVNWTLGTTPATANGAAGAGTPGAGTAAGGTGPGGTANVSPNTGIGSPTTGTTVPTTPTPPATPQ